MMKNANESKILEIFFIGLCSTLIFSACGKSSFVDSSQATQRKLDFLPDPTSDSQGTDESPEMTDFDPESDNRTPLPENSQPNVIPAPQPTPTSAPAVVPAPVVVKATQYLDIVLETEIRVRTLKDNVLEVVRTLNAGDVIRIEKIFRL